LADPVISLTCLSSQSELTREGAKALLHLAGGI
jgi:hypothetical protein